MRRPAGAWDLCLLGRGPQAAKRFLSGEPETARLILRDLVNATLGLEQLAKLTRSRATSAQPICLTAREDNYLAGGPRA
jgi:hypothetical protein